MINSFEQVYKTNPNKYGDKVALSLTFERGEGYRFRTYRFFEGDGLLWREVHFCPYTFKNQIAIDYPCTRQSKKRYQEAKSSAFAYIHSDAGIAALKAIDIELHEFVSEREYDYYAKK